MGFFDEKKRLKFDLIIRGKYFNAAKLYEEKTITIKVDAFASFATVNVYNYGWAVKLYSTDNEVFNGGVINRNEYTEREAYPNKPLDSNYTQNITKGSILNYANANIPTTAYVTDEDINFSDKLYNLEKKWLDTLPNDIYFVDYSMMGATTNVTVNSYITNPNSDGELVKECGLEYSLVFYDNDSDYELCPIFAEYGVADCFGCSSIDFKCVSKLHGYDYSKCAFLPFSSYIQYANQVRHYTLMHLLDNFKENSKKTMDIPFSEPPEIHYHVKLDGTKNPTVYLNWEVVAEELPEFFECHTIDIGVSYEENKAVVTLGTYEIMSEDTIKIAYGDLLKIADSAAFDVWWNNLKNGIGIGSIWLYFHSSYYKSDFFKCEIKQSFEVLDDLTYTAVSEPNGYPSLDLSEYVSGSDSDHDNEGDNSDRGDKGDGGSGSGVNPHSLLTTTYVMTPTRLKQLGSVLWGSGFMSNIKLVNNSPIENIVSVKMFPFTLPTSSDSEIVLGNVEMGVNGNILANNYSYEHEIGSVTISKHYNSFMDFAPYTRLMLYLPYVGVVELDNSLFMGRTLTIKYIIDIVLGTATVNLYANGIIIQKIGCQVGVDIPITSSNRASVEAGIVGNVLTSSIAGVASGGLLGGVVGGVGGALVSAGHAKYTTTTQGTPSSACSLYDYKNPILIIDRPSYQEVGGFAHSKGKMCLLNKTIKELSGFTIMDKNIEINNIRATKKEIDEIRNILSSVFYA